MGNGCVQGTDSVGVKGGTAIAQRLGLRFLYAFYGVGLLVVGAVGAVVIKSAFSG